MGRRIIPDVIGQQQQLLQLSGLSTVREAVRRMHHRDVGAVLITSAGRLEGIFTERDLLARVVAQDRHPDLTRLCDVMTSNPDTIEADESAVTALGLMNEHGYRHLPVMRDGQLVGIVSRQDFIGEEIQEVEDRLGHAQTF